MRTSVVYLKILSLGRVSFFFSHLEFYLISSCIVIGYNDVHETQNEITGEPDDSQEHGNLEDIDVVEAEMATVDQKAVNESTR